MRRIPIVIRQVLGLGLLVATASCGGTESPVDSGPTGPSTPGPVPGTLALTFTTPNGDDRAVHIRLSGANIDRLQVASGLTLYQAPGSASADILVLGSASIGSGSTIGTLQVPDVATVGSFSAQVLAVAADDYELRQSLASYSAGFSVR